MAGQLGKRPAALHTTPSKKRKLISSNFLKPQLQSESKKYLSKSHAKAKEKAADRGTIPIPLSEKDDEIDLSDQDLGVFELYGGSASFLDTLDHKGITRSKKETVRLHRLNKPVKQTPMRNDKLPPLDSCDEDNDSLDSFIDSELSGSSDEEDIGSDNLDGRFVESSNSDTEMTYELNPRKYRPSSLPEKSTIQQLPIKLADGRIHQTGSKFATAVEESEESEKEQEISYETQRIEDVSVGARFGRLAVVDVVQTKSRRARIQSAKEQIAGICQEIVADPENSLGLLRRLHTFSLMEISTQSHPVPISNDPLIRRLAILSQLAVYKDIIPGYRIRTLTDKEKAEKVSQMVARTRDWEQGLIVVYQTYLRSLEAELKASSEFADVALQSMCTLLTEATHFNFRVNLISCIVTRLSRKSWDKSSDLCLDTLEKVFREDLMGMVSLEIVRLLNRMVKEKRFNIHPRVLSCLLHLRLKTELGIRASVSKTDKDETIKSYSNSKAAARKPRGKNADQPHLSKKVKRALKEKREIERELREAEAEVDREERTAVQTETLKLLFVLYFRIIKNPHPTPLLPAALHGISQFAHLVNIDFFKDLMKVLKSLILYESNSEIATNEQCNLNTTDVQHRLLCIITAFKLLSGQGEALDIDLTEFISVLYAIILPLSLMGDIGTPPVSSSPNEVRPAKAQSVADMLFYALDMVFSPRGLGVAAPPWRSAAFAKRLLSASLHWPPDITLRALGFVRGLIAKNPKLEVLLCTEDRTFDGIFRPEVDDPQLCHPFGTSFWELHALYRSSWDAKVREEAGKLLNFIRI